MRQDARGTLKFIEELKVTRPKSHKQLVEKNKALLELAEASCSGEAVANAASSN